MGFGVHAAAGLGLTFYLTVVVIGCSFLLVRFRRRAGDLKIRARSPDLATFPAVYAIVVGGLLIPLQELLQLSGVGYPCTLTLVQSWLFLPVWGGPFVLRSLRVLIASRKDGPEKLGFFLRKRTTLAMEGFLCTVAVCIVITLSQKLSPYSRGVETTDAGTRDGACFMMMEWEFLLPFAMLQMTIFGVLGIRLRTVNDLLNISSELRVNFMLYLLFLCPYFVLQLHYRYRTDEDVPTSLHFLISAMVVLALVNTMWVSVGGLDKLMDTMGWDRWGVAEDGEGSTVGPSSHGPGGSTASVAGGSSEPCVAASVTRSDIKRWKKYYSDVPSIMRNANMSAVFGALANRFLCSESYNFLVAVAEFRSFTGIRAGPDLQHMLFVDICKSYVMVNSEQEINISHEQRLGILKYTSYRNFSPLGEAGRADIFLHAEREVAQMLQLNLLVTFHNSTAFTETCVAVDVEEHVWDLEKTKALIDADGSDGNLADAAADAADAAAAAPAGRCASSGSGGRGSSSIELAGLMGPRLDSIDDNPGWLGSSTGNSSWRGSNGSALLSHVGLCALAIPSR